MWHYLFLHLDGLGQHIENWEIISHGVRIMRIIIELWRSALGLEIFSQNLALRCLIYFGLHLGLYRWSSHIEIYRTHHESLSFNIHLPFFDLNNDTTRKTVNDDKMGEGYAKVVNEIVGHLFRWKIGEVK